MEQYLQIGEIRETIIDETAMEMSKEQIQEIQELADILQETSSEEEDIIIICKEWAFPVHSLISLVMFIAISSYWELGYRGLRSF